MKCRPLLLWLAATAALGGCARHRPPAPPPPPVRFVLEPAWQGTVWFYPHETYSLDTTGIAMVSRAEHARLTTDNDRYDAGALAAAMQTVQLPAIATVTNLENGRAVMVRVNDRGPSEPSRLIALTPRAAALLGITASATRVQVRIEGDLSTALTRQVRGRAGDLPIDVAPRGTVTQSTLAPLSGTTEEAARGVRATVGVSQVGEQAAAVVPARLPETILQGPPDPGTLMINAGSFGSERYAARRQALIAETGARVTRSRSGGQTTYTVRAGPFDTADEADAALARMLADGIIDARIVVDLP